MSDHSDFLELANELIDENGRAFAFQSMESTAADPLKPWRGTPAVNGQPVVKKSIGSMGVVVPAYGYKFGQWVVSEELLKRTDLLVLAAANDPDLKFTDKIVDGINTYGVLWFQLLKPGEQELIYIFGVTK